MEQIEITGIVVGIAATILAGIGYSISQIFKLGKNLGTYSHRFETMEKSIDHLNEKMEKSIGELKDILNASVKRLDDKVQHLDDKFDRLPCAAHGGDISKIQSFLLQKFPKSAALVITLKGSPRRLSEIGWKIFADIDGENFLKDNKEYLFKYIADRKPLAELDVEKLALEACQSLTTTPAFNKIKDYVYNAPPLKLEEGVTLELELGDMSLALSIPLRDMYLSEIGIKEETE
jgi:hypothetical protein